MSRIPKAGDILNGDDFDMIMEAVATRHNNFPDEPITITMGLVFSNIGDRFSPVTCIEQEWEDVKMNVSKGEGSPTCPNGHPLEVGPGLKLGWVHNK